MRPISASTASERRDVSPFSMSTRSLEKCATMFPVCARAKKSIDRRCRWLNILRRRSFRMFALTRAVR